MATYDQTFPWGNVLCLMLTLEDNVCSGEGPLIDIQLIITSFTFIIQSGTHERFESHSPFSGNMCPEDTSSRCLLGISAELDEQWNLCAATTLLSFSEETVKYFQNHFLFRTFLHLPHRHHHDISHHEISHHRDNIHIIVAKLTKLSQLGDAVVSRLWWQVELEK